MISNISSSTILPSLPVMYRNRTCDHHYRRPKSCIIFVLPTNIEIPAPPSVFLHSHYTIAIYLYPLTMNPDGEIFWYTKTG